MSNSNNLVTDYSGSLDRKTCSICKLELREGQAVLQCPHCSSLFHAEHLAEWLFINPECPICQSPLHLNQKLEKKLFNQFSDSRFGAFFQHPYIHQYSKWKGYTIIPKHSSVFSSLILLRRIILSITGIVVALASLVFSSFMIFFFGWGLKILFIFLGTLFSTIGMFLFLYINKRPSLINYNWKELIIAPQKIIIVDKKITRDLIKLEKENIVINASSIKKIEYTIFNQPTLLSHYSLLLKITSERDRVYNLGDLFFTNDKKVSNNLINLFRSLIKKYYNIEPSYFPGKKFHKMIGLKIIVITPLINFLFLLVLAIISSVI
jgi:hypothetical protein